MNEETQKKPSVPLPPLSRPGHSRVEHLPGMIVRPPPKAQGDIVIKGQYTASTGMEIPITLHTNKSGIIYRLWRQEMERRNPRKLTVEEDPSQLLASGPPPIMLKGEEPKQLE